MSFPEKTPKTNAQIELFSWLIFHHQIQPRSRDCRWYPHIRIHGFIICKYRETRAAGWECFPASTNSPKPHFPTGFGGFIARFFADKIPIESKLANCDRTLIEGRSPADNFEVLGMAIEAW